MHRLILLIVIILSLPLFGVNAQEDEDRPITNYYTPCAPGTAGSISTFHGINQDGKPPLDPTRHAFDFNCTEDLNAYAPTAGTVYAATPRYAGLLMIDDDDNGVCLVVLHLQTFEVTAGDLIEAGDLMGTHKGYDLHFAAVDGTCAEMMLYDTAARMRERPVVWRELGEELPNNILLKDAVAFVSENPGAETE